MNEAVSMLPGTLFDRYRVQSSAAENGIVRARCLDVKADRPMAVVGIDKDLLDHPGTGYTLSVLQADVMQARAATHPSVLQAEDMLQDDRRIYVVSELPEGLALDRLPRRVGNVSSAFVASAMVRLLSLIELCQRLGQSGLCLSPAEAYLSPNGTIKVENFATARLLHVARAIHGGNGGPLLGAFGAFREPALCRADDAERAAVMIETLAELPADDELRPVALRIAGILRNTSSMDNSIADAVEQLRGLHAVVTGKRPAKTPAGPSAASRRALRPGDYLFHQGDVCNGECYVLDEGLVQISKSTPDGRELYLDLSKPGDIIGEMAVLDDRPRMASALVLEPSEVVVVKGGEFLARLEKSDIIAVKLLEVMASRIRYQSSEIARLKALLGAKA